MKIGILANYLHTRKDILKFCESLTANAKPVLFLRKDTLVPLNMLDPGIELRYYELKRAGLFIRLWNVIWLYLFLLFGVKPKSINNYIITESFKFAEIKNSLYRSYRMFILKASQYTPQWISYDVYLQFLKRDVSVDLSGIDCFMVTSEVYDDYLFYKMINQPVPKIMYVYSWDHPCKMMRFSGKVDYYLVWSEGLREDLNRLQFIPLENIFVWGATQFTEIYTHLHAPNSNEGVQYPFAFFYFVCATGKRDLVKAEVELIARAANCIQEIDPTIRIVVRRYPFWKNSTLYGPLIEHKNIVMEEDSSNNSLQKYYSAEKAVALIHIGTTLGLEICYFDTPSLFLTFSDTSKQLTGFMHQYQNDKYLNLESYGNVIHNESELKAIVKKCLSKHDRSTLLEYNRTVAGSTKLRSMEQLSVDFFDLIADLVKKPNLN